jgi:hypothetical protein
MTEHQHPEPHSHHHHPEHHHPHPHEYHLIIDNRPYTWPKERITGNEIKVLAGVDPATYSVWEITAGPADDLEIGDHQEVDLKGREKKFIVGKKHSTEGADNELPADH